MFLIRVKSILVVFTVLVLVGCTATSTEIPEHNELKPPVLPAELLHDPIDIPDAASILKLTQEQADDFLSYFHAPERADIKGHRRLFQYIDNITYGFNYRGETFNASTALNQKSGNCMSLAVLTTALADLAEVEIGYQKINSAPVYKKENDVLLISQHVRSFLFDPNPPPVKEGMIVFWRARMIVDYFPSRRDVGGKAIDTNEFIALYYRNLASDYLLQGDYRTAFWYSKHAIELAPLEPENVSMMAVVLRRMDYLDAADSWYRYGISLTEQNLNLLSNYQILLRQLGKKEAAEELNALVEGIDDPNPYNWIKLGTEAYNQGYYSRSIRYYEKAVRLAPYLHEAYFGLAKSYVGKNDHKTAAEALKRAAENAYEDEDRRSYYAKLSALEAAQ